jgi:hypothetical protein
MKSLVRLSSIASGLTKVALDLPSDHWGEDTPSSVIRSELSIPAAILGGGSLRGKISRGARGLIGLGMEELGNLDDQTKSAASVPPIPGLTGQNSAVKAIAHGTEGRLQRLANVRNKLKRMQPPRAYAPRFGVKH